MLIEREQVNQKKAHLEDSQLRYFSGAVFLHKGGIVIKFVFLTPKFYQDYAHCPEMEQKQNRPYNLVLARVQSLDFAIPLRSNINHEHVVWSDMPQKCGLDLSKAVIITDTNIYIDWNNKPRIRQNEFNALKGKEHFIAQRMDKYIRDYIKALGKQHLPDQQLLVKFSTLQYFHNELGLLVPVATL